jgi:hypothetical protein
MLYVECCKLQYIIDFIYNTYDIYKRQVICSNGHIYYSIIKFKFYEFRKKFVRYYNYLGLDENFEVNP